MDPWEDEFYPPESLNSLGAELDARNDLLYMRRVVPNDVSLATYNNSWEEGVIYEMWDHTRVMEDTNFFVVNSEYNVYKCLDNNNDAPSTVEPLGRSLFAFNTSDGYMWKYMYNIPAFKRRKFLSRGFIPVQRAVSDSFYNRGAVEDAVVTSPGSGYVEILLTTLSVQDTRTGSGASLAITSVDENGTITGVEILNGGSNYANVAKPASVIITSIPGSGAVINLIAEDGEIVDVEIEDGGLNYEITDTVEIVTEACVLKPVISRDNGSILDVVILNPGSGYASTPIITVVEDLEVGTGLYGNPGAVIKAFAFEGSVVNITIEDPGINYAVDTSTIIVVQGDGEGASFAPVVVDGEVIDVVVDNAGIGYSYINLIVVGAGSGAVIQGLITQSDFISDQSVVEQSAIVGAIHAVRVTTQGDNYSDSTQVTIEGDGSGAEAVPVIEGGRIVKINMTSFGSGYTRANVVINDPTRPPSISFTDAEAYAILPPVRGHGFDAVEELYGDTVSIYSLLQGDVELGLIGQDYRQYGILRNPVDLLDRRRITGVRYFVSFDVQLSNASTIEPDDVLLNQSIRYRVVSKVDDLVTVQQLSFRNETPVGTFVREDDPEVEYGIQSIGVIPTVDKYSGDLLFVSNTPPFTPTTEQVVAVRTYIEI